MCGNLICGSIYLIHGRCVA
uniref:Uncharacterized protein n=1 Tax=Rhizophora mucronata TaxID=61149 RepID=A0A2P2N0K4_RHIMU